MLANWTKNLDLDRAAPPMHPAGPVNTGAPPVGKCHAVALMKWLGLCSSAVAPCARAQL